MQISIDLRGAANRGSIGIWQECLRQHAVAVRHLETNERLLSGRREYEQWRETLSVLLAVRIFEFLDKEARRPKPAGPK